MKKESKLPGTNEAPKSRLPKKLISIAENFGENYSTRVLSKRGKMEERYLYKCWIKFNCKK